MSTSNQFPKMRTQEDQAREDVEAWKNGGDRDKALILLRAFTSPGRHLPTTDDYGKVLRDAEYDFSRNDYSEALSAVRTLAEIAEFYKDLAEGYHDQLSRYGAVLDEYGGVSQDPFVLIDRDGSQALGAVEAITLDSDDLDSLWGYYVKGYLPAASESEKAWIAKTFAAQIEQNSEGSGSE